MDDYLENPWEPEGRYGSDWSAESAPALQTDAVENSDEVSPPSSNEEEKHLVKNNKGYPATPAKTNQGGQPKCWAYAISSFILSTSKFDESALNQSTPFAPETIIERVQKMGNTTYVDMTGETKTVPRVEPTGALFISVPAKGLIQQWEDVISEFRLNDDVGSVFVPADVSLDEVVTPLIDQNKLILMNFSDPNWKRLPDGSIPFHAVVIYGVVKTKKGDWQLLVMDPAEGILQRQAIFKNIRHWITARALESPIPPS